MSQVGDDKKDEGENGLLSPPMKYYPVNSGAVPFQRWINASNVNTFKEPSDEIRKWDNEREKLGWALSQIGITELALQKASELGRTLVVFLTQHAALVGENPAVIGSAPQLGSRDRSNALRAVELPPGDGWWFAVCCLPKNTVYDWRWVVMNKRHSKITRGECPRRNTYVHDKHHLHLAKWNLPSIMWSLDSLPLHKGSSLPLPYFLHGSFQLKSSTELSEGLDLTIESDDEVFLVSDDDITPVDQQPNLQHVMMDGNLPFHNGEPCKRFDNNSNPKQNSDESARQNGAASIEHQDKPPDIVVDPNDFTQYLFPVTEPHHKDVPLAKFDVPHKMERQPSDPELIVSDSNNSKKVEKDVCFKCIDILSNHDDSDSDLPQTSVIDIFGEPVTPSIYICDSSDTHIHDKMNSTPSNQNSSRLFLTPSPTMESQSDDSKGSSDNSDVSPCSEVPKLFTHLRDSLEHLSSYCIDSNDIIDRAATIEEEAVSDPITWDLGGQYLSTSGSRFDPGGACCLMQHRPYDHQFTKFVHKRLRSAKFTEFIYLGMIYTDCTRNLAELLPDIVAFNLKQFMLERCSPFTEVDESEFEDSSIPINDYHEHLDICEKQNEDINVSSFKPNVIDIELGEKHPSNVNSFPNNDPHEHLEIDPVVTIQKDINRSIEVVSPPESDMNETLLQEHPPSSHNNKELNQNVTDHEDISLPIETLSQSEEHCAIALLDAAISESNIDAIEMTKSDNITEYQVDGDSVVLLAGDKSESNTEESTKSTEYDNKTEYVRNEHSTSLIGVIEKDNSEGRNESTTVRFVKEVPEPPVISLVLLDNIGESNTDRILAETNESVRNETKLDENSASSVVLSETNISESYIDEEYLETTESNVVEPRNNDETDTVSVTNSLPISHTIESDKTILNVTETSISQSDISVVSVDSVVNHIPKRAFHSVDEIAVESEIVDVAMIECIAERQAHAEFAKTFVDLIILKALQTVKNNPDDDNPRTSEIDFLNVNECDISRQTNGDNNVMKSSHKNEVRTEYSPAAAPLLMCPEVDREPSDQGYADDVDDEYTIGADDGILMREMSPHDELAVSGSNDLEINSDSALYCEDMKTCISDADFVLRNEGFVADSDIELTPLKKKKRVRNTSECSSVTDSVTSNTSLMHEGENSRSMSPVFQPGFWGSFSYFVDYVCKCFCCSSNKK